MAKIRRKLVDASGLREEALEIYLSASPTNQVVLCEVAMIEISKGVAAVNTAKSVEILSRYLNQVFVLKPMRKLMKLKPRSIGICRRFIDNKETEGFRLMCESVRRRGVGDSQMTDFLMKMQENAERYFAKLEEGVEELRKAVAHLEKSFPSGDLDRFRNGQPASERFFDRLTSDVLVLAVKIMEMNGNSANAPLTEAVYSLEFRIALCVHLMNLDWIGRSGYQTANPKSLINLNLDMLHAAHATFFDGVISKDNRLIQIYQVANLALSGIFRTLQR